MIDAGSPFPDFSLTAHDGSTVSSEALEGTPHLVYFYPKADTPGCTKEACAFRDSWAGVQMAGLRVFGVSYDTPERNRKFAEKYGLQFLLLSDTDRELAAAVADGDRAVILFVVQRSDGAGFAPAADIDAGYADEFFRGVGSGVVALA